MRIIVLGGAGFEGSGIARDIVKSQVSEVIIADCNLESAQKIADDLNGKKVKVTAQFVDANNHEDLVKAIKDVDAVVSAIGPFYVYGEKTIRAAIDAKVPYVDINDDYDSTKIALSLDEEAKKAGVPIIIY